VCGPILLAAILIPAIELFVIIEVGARIGALTAVILVFVTAGLGLNFARGQGLSTLTRLQNGTLPADAAMLDGPLIALAALCLLFPGFVTDGLGALLLVPPVRSRVALMLIDRFGGPRGPRGPLGPKSPDEGGETIIVVQKR